MKLSLYFLTVCFILIGGAAEVFACSCMHMGSYKKPDQKLIDQTRKGSSTVFSGEVVKIIASKAPKNSPKVELTVYFKVLESWKGVTTENIVVSTSKFSNFCGFPFEVKQKYLVYTDGNKKLSTDLCSRTTDLENAAKDIEFLGEPEKTFAKKKNEKLPKNKR